MAPRLSRCGAMLGRGRFSEGSCLQQHRIRHLLENKLQNKSGLTLNVTRTLLSKIKKPSGPGLQAVTTYRGLSHGIIAAFWLFSKFSCNSCLCSRSAASAFRLRKVGRQRHGKPNKVGKAKESSCSEAMFSSSGLFPVTAPRRNRNRDYMPCSGCKV